MADVRFLLNMCNLSDPRLNRNWFRNVEMFKMSHFEPILGKKLRVFPEGSFFKHRYVFLRLTIAFARHIINIAY
jgi:hypothetical protein